MHRGTTTASARSAAACTALCDMHRPLCDRSPSLFRRVVWRDDAAGGEVGTRSTQRLAAMIKQNFIEDSQEISLIQNRLTTAGLILAILFFSGGFTVAIYGQMAIDNKADYRNEYPQIAIAISVGATLTLLTIASLLVCQQLSPTPPRGSWLRSRRWWFAASTIWLYLALTQAMSAGLTEV